MLVFLVSGVLPALAQPGAPPPAPQVQAARAAGPIRCDGILDEPAWAAVAPATEFHQMIPDQGARATMPSEFRVLYDDDAIYIGARLHDAAPESIQANLGRRDSSLPADRITVYIDPYHDHRSGYVFVVNAAGLKVDGIMFNDGAQDLTWDGVWEGRAHRDSLGWSTELRIPFSQMRFQSEAEPVWGINFKRVIFRRSEESLLAYTPRDGSGFVSRFPDLVGLQGIRPPRAIEVTPYVTSKADFRDRPDGDPFHDGSRFEGHGGLDLRAPVGRRLTLSATVNPDFGQVEVDPAIVNLSDVESTFEEKRPYFVEGASNFRFGREGSQSYSDFNWPEPTFFYSRRIGRAPQGAPPDADFVDVPIATSILGAAKLTGKLTPTTNFGTLQAVTGRADASLQTAGVRSGAEVEPLTYYGVTRALKEFGGRRAGLGLLSTTVLRRFEGDRLEDQFNRASLMGGLDGWYFLDPKQVWVASGWVGASTIRGSAPRIAAVQRSSRHYFQRPDAGAVEVDPDATSLTGYGGRVWLNKQNGRLMSNSGIGLLSPKFEVNDLGIQSRSDVVNAHTMLGWQWTANGRFKRYANTWAAIAGSRNFDGDLVHATLSLGGNAEFTNSSHSWWNAGYHPNYTDVRSTRGGPRMESPRYAYVNAGFNTNAYRKTFLSQWMSLGWSEAGHLNREGGVYVEWKPRSNLLVSAGPWLNLRHEDAQYVTTVADPAATRTYGSRYVFAELDQATVGADLRVNWTFTTELSFETYVQPFLSSGTYAQYRSLAEPGTYTFEPFAFTGNPNFDFGSLRGNAILRWEYQPGSTLYFVWTQQRDAFRPVGDFDLGRGMSHVLEADADNVFLVKASYHLGL